VKLPDDGVNDAETCRSVVRLCLHTRCICCREWTM